MNTSKKGILNIVTTLISQVVIIVTGVLIPKLILASYGSETNGLINSVTQIINYFSLFEAGVGLAALQALYRPVSFNNRFEISKIMVAANNFYKKTGLFYILSVLLLAILYPFFINTNIPYIVIFLIIIFSGLGNSIHFIYQAKYKLLMQAEGNSYVISFVTTIIQIILCFARIILMYMGYDIILVQFSYFAVCILQMIIYHIYVKFHYNWLDYNVDPNNESLSQKNSTLIHQISSLILNSTDVLLLTLLTKNLKIVSVYTVYNLIVTMVTTLIQQINSGFDFKLGQLFNTDKNTYVICFEAMETFNAILSFTSISIAYIFIVPFVRIYTAGITDINYIKAGYALFFLIGPLLTMLRIPSNSMVNYAGHFRKTQWRAIIETAINLSVSIALIPKFGIYGALAGTIIALLYRTNDLILYCHKHLLNNKAYSSYKKIICGLVIFIGVVLFCDNMKFYTSYIVLLKDCIFYGIIIFVLVSIVELIACRKEIINFIRFLRKEEQK
mgnify:CR=1 FL=1